MYDSNMRWFGFATIILALIVLISQIKNRQLITPKAAGGISKIEFSPGEIIVASGDKFPVYISALAYDTNNEPLITGVTYQWGISSKTSIGTLTTDNATAIFTPSNTGKGDLWVLADNQFKRSVRMVIGKPLIGDFNGDDTLQLADVAALLSVWTKPLTPVSTQNAKYDVSGDGFIGLTDVTTVLSAWTSPIVYGN